MSAEERTTPATTPSAEPIAHRAMGLSVRELDVFRLVSQGLTDAQIAAELALSVHTVHRHVANVRTRLGVRTRAAATAWAMQRGLI